MKLFRDLYDGIAKTMGFSDVNSFEVIKGDKDITIRSNTILWQLLKFVVFSAVLDLSVHEGHEDSLRHLET